MPSRLTRILVAAVPAAEQSRICAKCGLHKETSAKSEVCRCGCSTWHLAEFETGVPGETNLGYCQREAERVLRGVARVEGNLCWVERG